MEFLSLKIAGAAGEGIKAAGLMFNKIILRSGYFSHGYTEYPSLIRGGHNTYQINYGLRPVNAPTAAVDLIIALNSAALVKEKACLAPGGLITGDLPAAIAPLAKNTAALGLSCFLLNLDLNLLFKVIKENFQKKGRAVVEMNLTAARAGFETGRKKFKPFPALAAGASAGQILISGNEALALGAVAGGMKFYAAYPMTPASSILHYLAVNQKTLKIIVHHAEDEIGVMNLVLGAAYAGVRSMTATSGGGFSLMTEGLGLAGVTETPITLIVAMRPGPASGMPTWSGQGDLLFAVNASQDEFPRIVLAPGNPAQCFKLAKLAQNLAEKYQLPVIILTDKNLGESYYTVSQFPSKHRNLRFSLADTAAKDNQQPFARYRITSSGITPRPLPGQTGGICLTNSYEHDELGYAAESASIRTKQAAKRLKKLETILNSQDLIQPDVYGPAQAKTSLLAWGSSLGPLLDVLPRLTDTNLIHFSWLWPFPAKAFTALVRYRPRLIAVEANAGGQLARLIRQETGINVNASLNQWDGRPFFTDKLINSLSRL